MSFCFLQRIEKQEKCKIQNVEINEMDNCNYYYFFK